MNLVSFEGRESRQADALKRNPKVRMQKAAMGRLDQNAGNVGAPDGKIGNWRSEGCEQAGDLEANSRHGDGGMALERFKGNR